MSRRIITILAAAAAVFAVGAPAASAAEAVALPYCWGATYGNNTAQICAANSSAISGTVVDPGASTDCIIRTDTVAVASSAIIPPVYPCRIVGNVVTGVDDTGARLGGLAFPSVTGLSVRMPGNHWGTVYLDGGAYSVFTEGLCVGGGCPTNLANLISLVQLHTS